MVRYELVLSARSFAQPRQFHLQVSAPLDGVTLASILAESFGSTQWYLEEQALEDCQEISSRTHLLLTDLPRPTVSAHDQLPAALQLFVASGPDAGASLRLTPGTHLLGRCAPLWLQDPKIARHHARITVDQTQLIVTCEAGNMLRATPGRNKSEAATELRLTRGTRFWLGDTELHVGDPVLLDNGQSIGTEQLQWQLPDKPELQRLIALCLAALLPMLSGVLLAVFTGSMLFLLLSGASAMLGIFPAGQMVIERRRWKAKAVVYRRRVIDARAAYAVPLGISVLAGLDRVKLAMPTLNLPPLVFGQGLWSPAATEDLPKSKRRRRSRTALDAPCPSKVFTPSFPGACQIIGADDRANTELLLAILARFLPAVLRGHLELVLDPRLTCLPASLLLLPGVSTGVPASENSTAMLAPVTPQVRTLYVLSVPAQPCENSMVLSISQGQVPTGTWWVNPQTHEVSLEDTQLELHQVERLSNARFSRLINRTLTLAEAQERKRRTNLAIAHSPDEANRLSAHIGVTERQDPIILDFDADGPHMLICGTTGSGKSEALRRIVKQLATENSPEDVAFALVDFKGGAGLSVFAQLPHVQLFASDLDAAAAQRTLAQLEVEVTRREEHLAHYRCSDLLEYRQLSSPGPALPRLVVVIDEFRVFSESIPEANPRIDRLAAVGRALGIHLVLSTQRPAGTLTGQTRANLNTIIALRVKDPGESIELVGIPDAASLTNPGQAVIHCATRATRKFQFALAVEPPPYGELAERGPHELVAKKVCTFGALPSAQETLQALHQNVIELGSSWDSQEKLQSPFAQALPSNPTPPELSWFTEKPNGIWCGLVDRLDCGTLEPLQLGGLASHNLLVCGLPEAGPRQLLTELSQLPRQVLSIGPQLLSDDEQKYPHLLQVTGQDVYEFLDAVDYLDQPGEHENLLVLVHGVGQLQSALHPQHFQRFDEVLGALLRRGSPHGPTIVISVDRDQNLLKSAGLCSEQWYFPFHATDSLKMSWPRIPTVTNRVGSGYQIRGTDVGRSIQLGPARAATVAEASWPRESTAVAGMGSAGYLRVGSRSLVDAVMSLPTSTMSIVICADRLVRNELSQSLCQRWGVERIIGLEEFEVAQSQCTNQSLGLVLDQTSDPRLPALLNAALSRALNPILFVPPSSRLAYEVGAPGMVLDDRCVVVVEAHHPHDLQPMPWEPLGTTCQSSVNASWRAVASFQGRPRAISINK